MNPQEILEQTRRLIQEHSGNDPDKWWYANRFVFARLHLDERKTKTEIKRRLIEAKADCYHCGKSFEGKGNIHLHRLDGNRGYREGNCVLMHQNCHQDYHSKEKMQKISQQQKLDTAYEKTELKPIKSNRIRKKAEAVVRTESKLYSNKTFLYWWDIPPARAEGLDHFESVDFIKKETNECCNVSVDILKKYLIPDRQASRGKGNWGIKVLADHPDELAFEPSSGKKGQYLFLPVTWMDEAAED